MELDGEDEMQMKKKNAKLPEFKPIESDLLVINF